MLNEKAMLCYHKEIVVCLFVWDRTMLQYRLLTTNNNKNNKNKNNFICIAPVCAKKDFSGADLVQQVVATRLKSFYHSMSSRVRLSVCDV